MRSRSSVLCVFAFLVVGLTASPARAALSLSFDPSADRFSRRWAVEAGFAGITDKTLASILTGDINFPGRRGGYLYHLGASYLLGEIELGVGEHEFRPQLDLPVFVEVFDENARNPFPSYNAALRARWVDFPWNDHLRTSAAIGWGLSYSVHVPAMEKKREDKREDPKRPTHFKFTLPIDVSFALPRWPQHQMMLFIAHQSAGRWFGLFGRGGVNSVGIGYRWGYD